MDMSFLYAAVIIMLIIILRDILKKRYGFDMDNVNLASLKALLSGKKIEKPAPVVIDRSSGMKNLVLVDTGANKATVMATLRQITGMDYKSAKLVVEAAPFEFMKNVSDKEADLTKKALEFVGAKVEIK